MKMEAPVIYRVASNHKVLVADIWEADERGRGRRLQLLRHLNDWELDQMTRVMGFLDQHQILHEREDYRKWSRRHNGSFTVKSCYDIYEVYKSIEFPWKVLWGPKVLFNIQFLCGQL